MGIIVDALFFTKLLQKQNPFVLIYQYSDTKIFRDLLNVFYFVAFKHNLALIHNNFIDVNFKKKSNLMKDYSATFLLTKQELSDARNTKKNIRYTQIQIITVYCSCRHYSYYFRPTLLKLQKTLSPVSFRKQISYINNSKHRGGDGFNTLVSK